MKEQAKFIIVDKINSTALYGVGHLTLRFTTRETANEVASQFFESKDEFLIIEIFTT